MALAFDGGGIECEDMQRLRNDAMMGKGRQDERLSAIYHRIR